MKFPRLFPTLRLLLRIARAVEGINSSLKRIADSYDPPRDLTPVSDDPPMVVTSADRTQDFAAIDRVTVNLQRMLGRDPDPDEVIRALDDLEEDPNPDIRVRIPGR
jgi:hypothetical protein